MKAVVVFLVGVGLASASVRPAPIAANGGQVVPNAFLNSSAGLGSGNSGSATGSSLSPDSNLNLQGLNAGGLNLGDVNTDNQADILNAIQLMMSSLCLGGLAQVAQLQQLGQVAQLQMFLQLAELMNLAQSGLLNLSEIQDLASSGLLSSGFDVAGVLKRETTSYKKVVTRRLRGRRIPIKRQACKDGSIVSLDGNGAAGLAPVSTAGVVGGQVAAVPGVAGATRTSSAFPTPKAGALGAEEDASGSVSPVLAPFVIGTAA